MLFVGVGAKMLQAWSSARTARRLALLRLHRLEIVDLWQPSKTTCQQNLKSGQYSCIGCAVVRAA
jgi:hypothetical protein